MIELFQALTPVVGQLNVAMVGRLLLTLVLCGLFGLKRSTRDRASGFHPQILVGLGACLMTLAGVNTLMLLAGYVISGTGTTAGQTIKG